MKPTPKAPNRYTALLTHIFDQGYKAGRVEIPFHREELEAAALALGIALPKNLGDVIYSIRYRTALPPKILKTQPPGKEWVIEGRGKSKYVFRLVSANRILPNPLLSAVKIPDATPELVSAYSLSDEQALLAKVRYNRLLDIFLGLASYSLQNHLRTTVPSLGQVEVDEIYAGVDKKGCQYVIPVQAKGGSDKLSAVQTKQDMACCAEKFPELVCRPVSAQLVGRGHIALFELCLDNGEVRILEEKHYKLVPSAEITSADLALYRR